MTEIELRATPSIKQADAIIDSLIAKGAKWVKNERLLMDFSDGVSSRTSTVMLRSNNGQVELVVKSGGIADTKRQEASIQSSGSLSEALKTLSLLGYTKANYGLRSMLTCEYEGVEYSIRKIIDIKDQSKILGINFEIELKKRQRKRLKTGPRWIRTKAIRRARNKSFVRKATC